MFSSLLMQMAKFSIYDDIVRRTLLGWVRQSFPNSAKIDLGHIEAEWRRYLAPQVALLAAEKGALLTHRNADSLLPDLSWEVMEGSSNLWNHHVLPMISRTLSHTSTLESALRRAGLNVQAITPGFGDPHRGGTTVTNVLLEDESSLYFKPGRDSKAGLLQSVSQAAGLQDCMHIPRDRSLLDGYLQEALEPDTQTHDNADHFWFNAGQFCALADVLRIKDCHYQNIIPVNGSVALVDDETVLSSSLGVAPFGISSTLLVQDPEKAPLGLTAAFLARQTPSKSKSHPRLVRNSGGTCGELKISHERYAKPRNTEIFQAYGTVQDHLRVCIEGIKAGYGSLLQSYQDGSLRQAYEGHQTSSRVVVTSTWIYRGVLASLAGAPLNATQKEMNARVDLLDSYKGVGRVPSIVKSEKNQLMGGDIPFFSARTNGKFVRDQTTLVAQLQHAPSTMMFDLVEQVTPSYVDKQIEVLVKSVERSQIPRASSYCRGGCSSSSVCLKRKNQMAHEASPPITK